MAIINHSKALSSIQIKNDTHFIFGNLDPSMKEKEKLKLAIKSFNTYFKAIGQEKPEVLFNWRKVSEEGQWVLTDDLRIMQVLKLTLKGTRTDSSASYNKGVVRFCNATFPINEGVFLDSELYEERDRYRITNKNVEYDKRLKERDKPTFKEERFVSYVAHGKDPAEAYMKSFSTKNKDYAKMSGNRLLSQERIRESVNSKVENLMDEEGVSKRYILQSYKDLIDQGLMNIEDCGSAVRGALQDLSKMQAMFPEKNTERDNVSGVFEEIPDAEIEEIENTEQRMISNEGYNATLDGVSTGSRNESSDMEEDDLLGGYDN